MPMNFFEDQARAKKRTTLLVIYFVIAVVLTIVIIDSIIVSAIAYARLEHYFFYHGGEWVVRRDNLYPLIYYVTIIASPAVLSVIIIGSLTTSFKLRGGGIAVADMVKARTIHPDTTDLKERRFINVVEEMSIASGVPVPKLYVMDDEHSINAFVSGFESEDTVMVASKGALDKLSRQELQSVVGHEFSHIFHSDMQISLRIMGITAGLLILGKIGSFILRSTFYSRRSKSDGRIQLAVILAGVGILAVGFIGLMFGRLMKAAISRQRELLADASSVAYTRNPQGLIFALKRIAKDSEQGHLKSANAEDVSHICFAPALQSYLSGAFSTHPPIPVRIKRLDPKGQYAKDPLPNTKKPPPEPPPKSTAQKTGKESGETFMRTMMGATILAGAADSIDATAKSITNSIGDPLDQHMTLAEALHEQIPNALQTIAHQPREVAYLWYAMMLPQTLTPQLEHTLGKKMSDGSLTKIMSIQKVLFNMKWGSLLPLAQIALPAFKMNSPDVMDKMIKNTGAILSHTKPHYFQYGLYALLCKAANQKKEKASYKTYSKLTSHANGLQIVISVLVHYSGDDTEKLEAQYKKIMQQLLGKSGDIGQLVSPSPFVFQAALSKLNHLSPQAKEKFLNACFDCIEHDHKITTAEADLVRVIASIIECPIPPIISGATPHG